MAARSPSQTGEGVGKSRRKEMPFDFRFEGMRVYRFERYSEETKRPIE